MTAIARALSQTFPVTADIAPLKTIATFCCLGLLISLAMAMIGLDLTAGF
jgi:hypothetical protein